MKTATKKIYLVAIVNTLRSDDGVAAHVVNMLPTQQPGIVKIINTQQMDTALLHSLVKYDRVIFVDAAVNEDTVSLQELPLKGGTQAQVSHQLDVNTLVALAGSGLKCKNMQPVFL